METEGPNNSAYRDDNLGDEMTSNSPCLQSPSVESLSARGIALLSKVATVGKRDPERSVGTGQRVWNRKTEVLGPTTASTTDEGVAVASRRLDRFPRLHASLGFSSPRTNRSYRLYFPGTCTSSTPLYPPLYHVDDIVGREDHVWNRKTKSPGLRTASRMR